MDFPGSPRLLNGIGNEGGGIEEIRAQDRHVAGVHLPLHFQLLHPKSRPFE